jgi:hypothetical protein
MAVRSNDSLQLHDLLRQPLGEEAASKLMEFLPPVGWADVATKQDLDRVAAEIRADLQNEIRRLIMWLVGIMMPTLLAGMGLAAAIGH